jgi:pimeloyl-ACP methyl ester carboxylesterase
MRKTVSINNYEFNYVEKGTGEKVILIHGSSSDYRTWENQINVLSKDYHVISYSRRYHYPNKRIERGNDYSMKEHVEDLKGLINYFGNTPVNIIGHSYGALIGIELACTNPEIIKKMILAEPPAIRLFVSNTPKPREILSLLFKRPKTAISIIKLGAIGIDPATKAAQKDDMVSAMQLTGKAILGKQFFNNLSEKRKEQALINLTAAELTGSGFLPLNPEKLKQIDIPILLVTGEKSPKVFGNLADRLEELFLNVKRVEILNASHIMHEDNFNEYNSKITSFLKENRN